MNVLVCDDNTSRGDAVNESVRAAGQSTLPPLTGKELTDALRDLFDGIKSYRIQGDAERQWDFVNYRPIQSRLDDADVLLLDNNLTLLDNDGPPMTAESIAGYVRAFTEARYIVSLNMNPDVDFDLRYLVGDFLTRADLAINGEHLENKYLWTGRTEDADHGFCPRYWPRLRDVADYRQRQIEFIITNYDNSILDSLGFKNESIQMLSRHARGALSPAASTEVDGTGEGLPLREITFCNFFLAKNRALPIREERDRLNAAYPNNEAVRKVVARIVAADIDLWLRRDVIGPQEPLVDVPHLTTRFPFLLGTRANELESWNDILSTSEPPFGWDPQIYENLVRSTRFELEEIWMQRPCFWWSELNNDEHLNLHLLASRGQVWADVVFCEDISCFQYRAGDDKHSAPVEFVAEFEGVWNRRHIARLEDVHYAPLTRLAL